MSVCETSRVVVWHFLLPQVSCNHWILHGPCCVICVTFSGLRQISRLCATDLTNLPTLELFTSGKLEYDGRFSTILPIRCTLSRDSSKPNLFDFLQLSSPSRWCVWVLLSLFLCRGWFCTEHDLFHPGRACLRAIAVRDQLKHRGACERAVVVARAQRFLAGSWS